MESEEEERPQDVEEELKSVDPECEASDFAIPCDAPGGDCEQGEKDGPGWREKPTRGLERRLQEVIVPGAKAKGCEPSAQAEGDQRDQRKKSKKASLSGGVLVLFDRVAVVFHFLHSSRWLLCFACLWQ